MQRNTATTNIEQKPLYVKSTLITHLTPKNAAVIHHKVSRSKRDKCIVSYSMYGDRTYGVSKAQRVLSPQLLLSKIDYVRDCLRQVLGLTRAQSEITVSLLRLWAYYGSVYPKESQVTEENRHSKATYWRTIRTLKCLGLINVVNRYVIRPEAQISNLLKLEKLVIVIAKYLSEHTCRIWPDWVWPYLRTPWPEFWDLLDQTPEARAGP